MDEYKVVCNYGSNYKETLRRLQDDVNVYLQNGWQLQGGITVCWKPYEPSLWKDGGRYLVCQAIVK